MIDALSSYEARETEIALQCHRDLPRGHRVISRLAGHYPSAAEREQLRYYNLDPASRIIEDVVETIRWTRKRNGRGTSTSRGQEAADLPEAILSRVGKPRNHTRAIHFNPGSQVFDGLEQLFGPTEALPEGFSATKMDFAVDSLGLFIGRRVTAAASITELRVNAFQQGVARQITLERDRINQLPEPTIAGLERVTAMLLVHTRPECDDNYSLTPQVNDLYV